MKKLLTLILALLLVVGLSAPAMAFTSDTQADDDSVPYDLKIYLVDYEDNDLFGLAALPESDRGYAKNEIVAAVVELYVPEDEIVQMPDNLYLILSGENVDFDITDNYVGDELSFETSFVNDGLDISVLPPIWGSLSHDKIHIRTLRLPGEEAYRWLFFAKVTGDGASLTAKLWDGLSPEDELGEYDPVMGVTLDGLLYSAGRAYDPDGDMFYIITDISLGSEYAGYSIKMLVDEDHKSTGMILFNLEWTAVLGVNTKGELGVIDPANPAKILTSGDLYDDAMDFYNDVVVDVFKLDYFKIGNYVRDSYFEHLVSPRTLIATVEIAPWTAYVTVPDNIVVDPPKTGDAASIMGFVMVVLSGAGVAALRRRG